MARAPVVSRGSRPTTSALKRTSASSRRGSGRAACATPASVRVRVALAGQQAVLDDLGPAAAHLARRQGRKGVHVFDHQAGLVEGAQVVLALAQVDGDLAAHGGVDHGEDGGRRLDQAHAPQKGGRGVAGEVADHAAAQGDDRVAARGAQIVETVVERGEHRGALGLLTGRQHRRRRRASRRP